MEEQKRISEILEELRLLRDSHPHGSEVRNKYNSISDRLAILESNLPITHYSQVIKNGYSGRVEVLRNFIYLKSVRTGNDLTPFKVVDFLNKSDSSGTHKNLLFNGFTSPFGKLLLLIDIYESCDFVFLNKKLTIDNIQNYF